MPLHAHQIQCRALKTLLRIVPGISDHQPDPITHTHCFVSFPQVRGHQNIRSQQRIGAISGSVDPDALHVHSVVDFAWSTNKLACQDFREEEREA